MFNAKLCCNIILTVPDGVYVQSAPVLHRPYSEIESSSPLISLTLPFIIRLLFSRTRMYFIYPKSAFNRTAIVFTCNTEFSIKLDMLNTLNLHGCCLNESCTFIQGTSLFNILYHPVKHYQFKMCKIDQCNS